MKRTKPVIVGSSLAAFGVYAVMTGGLAVSSIRDFGGQRAIRLAEGLRSAVWLEPKSSTFGIPLIFQYYGAGKPFALRIQVWDDSKQYRALEITEVVLEYQDGEVVRKTDEWSRQLKPYTESNSSSSGLIQTEMYMLSDRMDGLVLYHADVRITLRGQFVKSSGERVAFEASESFKSESRSGVTTYWSVLAGC